MDEPSKDNDCDPRRPGPRRFFRLAVGRAGRRAFSYENYDTSYEEVQGLDLENRELLLVFVPDLLRTPGVLGVEIREYEEREECPRPGEARKITARVYQ